MSTFPTSLDNLPESHADNTGEIIHASTINNLASAVNAVESVTQPVVNGITADVTAANLNALTGGGATSLHSHAGGGPASGIQYVDVQLNNAQILTLWSSAVEIMSAPGSDLMIVVHGAFWFADFTAGAYGNVGSTPGQFASVQLVADPNGNFDYMTLGSDQAGGIFGQTRKQWWMDLPLTLLQNPGATHRIDPFTFGDNASNWNNQPLAIGLNNPEAGSDLNGGNPANTLSVRIWYSIVPAVPFGA